MNEDNKKLGYIEGGRFESIKNGDDRDATIVEIKMPDNFALSSRPVIIVEIDEWDKLQEYNKRLLVENNKFARKMDEYAA